MIKVKDFIHGYAIIQGGMPYICTIKPVKESDDLWHYSITVMADLSHLNSGEDEQGNLFYSSENRVVEVETKGIIFTSEVGLILKVIRDLQKKGLIMSLEEFKKETEND